MTIAAQVYIAIGVWRATKHMGQEWPQKVEENSSVLVVRDPKFWGPVHLLVPATCKEVSHWNHELDDSRDAYNKALHMPENEDPETAVRREQQVAPSATTTLAAKTTESTKAATKAATKADEKNKMSGKDQRNHQEEASEEDQMSDRNETVESERRLVFRQRELFGQMSNPWFPKVKGCFNHSHKEKTFLGPTSWHRYFSMISLSAMVNGKTTMEKLIASRNNNQMYLFWILIIVFVLKYGLKISDIVSFMCSHKYVQLWNGGRTKIDKLLESMMIHGLAVVFTLAMQLTMCTNFLTFWNDEGFFTMSYIPGLGFVIFFISFVIISVYMVLDRWLQWMLKADNIYIWTFWAIWCVWMLLVTVPMLGYSVYVIQFVWEIKTGHMLRTEPFSVEFVDASHKVCDGALKLTVIAVLELLLILKLDWEEASSRQRGQQ